MSDLDAMVAEERCMERIRALRLVVGTLIAWMAESANAPITIHEARQLLKQLDAIAPAAEDERQT